MVKWLPYHNDHSHIAVMPCHHCHITFTIAPSLYRHIAKSPSPYHNPLLPYSMFPDHHYHIVVSPNPHIAIFPHHHISPSPYYLITISPSPYCHMAIPYCNITITILPYCHVTFIIWPYHHCISQLYHITIIVLHFAISPSPLPYRNHHVAISHISMSPYILLVTLVWGRVGCGGGWWTCGLGRFWYCVNRLFRRCGHILCKVGYGLSF